MKKSWPGFLSSVIGSDGSVDPGYLAMAVGVTVWLTCELGILIIGAGALAATRDHAATLQALGIALGAASTGFATMLGAVGLFRWGDKPHPNTFTETTATQRTATTEGVKNA